MEIGKEFKAVIEWYSNTFIEGGNKKEDARAYESPVISRGLEKKTNYSGYRIKLNEKKKIVFAENYIEEVQGHFLIKEGPSFEDSRVIGVEHNYSDATQRAYENIVGKPKEKLLILLGRAHEGKLSKKELEGFIFDKKGVLTDK
jgi:hypothetical protein